MVLTEDNNIKKDQTSLSGADRKGTWNDNKVTSVFTSSPVDLELNRDFNGEDYEYEDEAKLVIFPDHFEIPLPNIEELPALVSESVLHGLLCCVHACQCWGCTQWFPRQVGRKASVHSFV